MVVSGDNYVDELIILRDDSMLVFLMVKVGTLCYLLHIQEQLFSFPNISNQRSQTKSQAVRNVNLLN